MPLDHEDSFDSENFAFQINQILRFYGLTIDDIAFITQDNCNVNKSIAARLNLPMLGCYSHRFSLACEEYYEEFDGVGNVLWKINKFMQLLKTAKKSGKLRQVTKLRPIVRSSQTRWDRTSRQVTRYLQLKPLIDQNDAELLEAMPTNAEHLDVVRLNKNFANLLSVTKELQSQHRPIHQARALFDSVTDAAEFDDPCFDKYLGPSADIIYRGAPANAVRPIRPGHGSSLEFEHGLTKIARGAEADLSNTEAHYMRKFKKVQVQEDEESDEDEEDQVLSFAQRALQNANKRPRAEQQESAYFNVDWVPVTSNIVERLFSLGRLTLPYLRKAMSPEHVNMLLMLKINRELWSVHTVCRLVTVAGALIPRATSPLWPVVVEQAGDDDGDY
jgi:hypothetical protein